MAKMIVLRNMVSALPARIRTYGPIQNFIERKKVSKAGTVLDECEEAIRGDLPIEEKKEVEDHHHPMVHFVPDAQI